MVQAIMAVDAMSMSEHEKLGDEIFAHQPNLLSSILVLSRLGATGACQGSCRLNHAANPD
jgi:hypothetical protein